jgi:4-carboxymuconolactone decarboxylase
VQSYLVLGYPAALNALALWRERGGRGAAHGLAPEGVALESAAEAAGAAGAEPGSGGGEWARWRARGEVVCARVYGGQYGRLRENVARLHPELAEWMVTEGYGKVLGRPGLALEVRELCIAVLLAGLDAEPQLRSHLRGALLVGATPAEVGEALELAAEVLPPGRMAVAREVWGEVRRRWEARGAH